MSELKAIETHYGGYRFRSRLEARWAVFLDSIRETWQYEREGYSLPSGAYLPDFWLPRLKLHLEIKADAPTKIELKLCEELFSMDGNPIAIAWGLPFRSVPVRHPDHFVCPAERLAVWCFDLSDSSGGTVWWDDSAFVFDAGNQLVIATNDWRADRTFHDGNYKRLPFMLGWQSLVRPIPQDCFDAATSARFEYSR
jgi:hypothetical protein